MQNYLNKYEFKAKILCDAGETVCLEEGSFSADLYNNDDFSLYSLYALLNGNIEVFEMQEYRLNFISYRLEIEKAIVARELDKLKTKRHAE